MNDTTLKIHFNTFPDGTSGDAGYVELCPDGSIAYTVLRLNMASQKVKKSQWDRQTTVTFHANEQIGCAKVCLRHLDNQWHVNVETGTPYSGSSNRTTIENETINWMISDWVDKIKTTHDYRGIPTNHYEYIEKYGKGFSKDLNISDLSVMAVAHGDKCRQYFSQFEKNGISQGKGSLLFLLTYDPGYCDTVRSTENGFVAPIDWIIDCYNNDKNVRAALDKLPG